jgi:aminoglycoside phosphotransferase (APT) family kinase protein
MSETPPTTYTFHALVPHPSEPRLLALEHSGQDTGEPTWALPQVSDQKPLFADDIADISRDLHRLLGLELSVLRCAHFAADIDARQRVDLLYAMDNLDPSWTPGPGMRWLGREDLPSLRLALEEQRPALETWLAEAETGQLPALRAPWARKGWLATATYWIDAQLAGLGLARTGRIEQVRSWGISTILRVPVDPEPLYFKAVPPLFISEPPITQALAARFPGRVPTPLAITAWDDQAWMLMRPFHGDLLENAPVSAWEDAVRLLAQIQMASIPDLDDLLAAGCADRRLHVLASQVDPLLADDAALSGLEPSEIDRLRALAPRLKAMCAELAAYRVPQTLAHGDFHANNVVVGEAGIVIFDWTDACIAHPFLDMPTILEYGLPSAAPGEPDPSERVRAAYLQQWTAFEPIDRLHEAFALAWPLGSLHQAISYRNIAASLEPAAKSEMAGGIVRWLRVVLRLLGGGTPNLDSDGPE